MEVSKAVLVVPRLQLLEQGLYFRSAPYPIIMTLRDSGDDSIGGPLIIILLPLIRVYAQHGTNTPI